MQTGIRTVFQLLAEADVEFLVVGGVAVVLHGHLRSTADLDLVLRLTEENARRAMQALSGAGFLARAPVSLLDFADPDTREAWIQTKGLTVFSLWHPQLRGFELDLFVREPFPFSEVYERSVAVTVGTSLVRVVSIPDLIALKQRAGRPRDLEDILALTALGSHDG